MVAKRAQLGREDHVTRPDRTVIGVAALIGLSLAGCQSSELSPSSTASGSTQSPSSTTVTTSTPPPPPVDAWGNALTVGPPGPDIPRFTVDGEEQNIDDWYAMLESGRCERLVHATSTFEANRDNQRATYALALLYGGAAHACLQEWVLAAIDLEAATICQDDLTSLGNSDQQQPLDLLRWAIGYVEGHGEHVGGRDPEIDCGPEATPTASETPSAEVSPTVTSSSG